MIMGMIKTPSIKEACNMVKRNFLLALIAAGSLILFTSLFRTQPARARGLFQETEKYCLSCHNDPNKEITLPSDEVLSVYIGADALHQSVHSQAGIECEACHTNITTYPHPPQEYPTHRELSLAYYQVCQKCHPANYQKTLDSIHAQMALSGNPNAPICTDCHGSHDILPPAQPRSRISTTCGQCHAAIVDQYKQSVHGAALIEENNQDVPVCTDCHGVHNIQDPRTVQFRIREPELCAGCHANAQLMSKYNLPANVYDIYKTSWHGLDLTVFEARWPTIWHESAICTDCHGIHDIRKTADPASHVNSANLLVTCQKCHPKAGPNWTGAWTGHNVISLSRTPSLYYTKVFYTYLVPVILWMCVIYVALQIIRATVERVRRNLS
jgi:predicted CXXCH cytochrome family protein